MNDAEFVLMVKYISMAPIPLGFVGAVPSQESVTIHWYSEKELDEYLAQGTVDRVCESLAEFNRGWQREGSPVGGHVMIFVMRSIQPVVLTKYEESTPVIRVKYRR